MERGCEGDRRTDPVNEVVLRGRVTQLGEERTLPSGDVVLTWRLVVDRPPARRSSRSGVCDPGRGSRRTVDVVDIACWSAATRRVAGRLELGAVVHVEGALRRRFFRGTHGVQSRTEVEARLVRRLRDEEGPASGPATGTGAGAVRR